MRLHHGVQRKPANFPRSPSEFRVLGGYTFADENNRNVWEADRGNFQPRLGVSYQLGDKTVLRADSACSWRRS